MKQLIMDEYSLKKLKDFEEIRQFLDFIRPYYPEINIEEDTIVEIEQSLFHTYIKLIGKIILFSPENMRRFLRTLLLKFEISNIKQLILGSITGMVKKEKSKRVNFFVEELLEQKDFINNLLEITSLDEIQLFMKNTRYNKAIREGILYFKNNAQIFVLEAFLDKEFYKNLKRSEETYSKKEAEMINLYIKYEIEIYNLKMISRGIKNNIDRKLLSQFLINEFLFFNKEELDYLLKFVNIEQFILYVEKYLRTDKELKSLLIPIELSRKHLKWSLEGLYQVYYFKKFKIKIDDIEYSTIFKILELIIKKDREIKFNIMPNVIRIIHKKYEELDVMNDHF
ncbi:MAG: V-type ATPase subunit, partial [Promethearchaeia archaeon]